MNTPVPVFSALLLAACLAGCASAPPRPAASTASPSPSASTSAPATTPVPASSEAALPPGHLAALEGAYFPLVAESNGRTYRIHVRLPEGYADAPERRWPVVYVLDGDSLFPLLAPTHLFLGYDEGLPEAIIVGIAYGGFDPAVNHRNVDFTGLAEDTQPGEGGAEAFHRFLQQELLPEVEGRWRADATRRVLVGQSRGGYFVLWSAVHGPDLFRGRIASNPSLDPAREQLFAPPAAHARDDLRLVVASGARDTPARVRNAAHWHAQWSGRADAPWEIERIVLPDGTHAASIGEVYRRAMLWLFREAVAAPPR